MKYLYDVLGYDEYFNELLQKQVKITLNDKVIRQGVFALYSYRNFLVELYFKSHKDVNFRKTEIPIPFKISKQNNCLLLDYHLHTILPENILLKTMVNKPSTNKYYNNLLRIEILNATN